MQIHGAGGTTAPCNWGMPYPLQTHMNTGSCTSLALRFSNEVPHQTSAKDYQTADMWPQTAYPLAATNFPCRNYTYRDTHCSHLLP